MSKCPYCFREIGTWNRDPILLPTGSEYKWSDEEETILEIESDVDQRIYKGIYQIWLEECKEIQDALIVLEQTYLDEGDWSTFSPMNSSGYFQITGQHIKEMRDSVEKLLTASSLEKSDYFNYDEDGNHIIRPEGDKTEWTDPIDEATDLKQFQVKYIHIEDLRHNITTIIEKFNRNEDQLVLKDVEMKGDFGIWTVLQGVDTLTENHATIHTSSYLIYNPGGDCYNIGYNDTDEVVSTVHYWGEIDNHKYKVHIIKTGTAVSTAQYSDEWCYDSPGWKGITYLIMPHTQIYEVELIPYFQKQITTILKYGTFDITDLSWTPAEANLTWGAVIDYYIDYPIIEIRFYFGIYSYRIFYAHSADSTFWATHVYGIVDKSTLTEECLYLESDLPVIDKQIDLYTHIVQRLLVDELTSIKIIITPANVSGVVSGWFGANPKEFNLLQNPNIHFTFDNIGLKKVV
jgi:hypothetical protein